MIILTLALTFVSAFSDFPQIILIAHNSILFHKQKTKLILMLYYNEVLYKI